MIKTIVFTIIFLFAVLNISAQKIVLQLDAIPSNTPSVSKANLKYNKDFAYSFTFDDATVDAYTCALPLFKGGFVSGNAQTYPGLFFTDGCGNDVPFRAGIAWNSANPSGVDIHTGNVPGQLTWKQLDSLYDFGWDVVNHSFTHRSQFNGPMSGNDYTFEIVQNRIAVQNNTQKRIEMPLFVAPSGDTFYNSIAYQQGNQLVFNQPGNIIGFGGLDVTADFNFDNKVVHRMLLEESLTNTPTFLDRTVMKTTGGAKIWYNEFTHRIDNFNTSTAFGFKDFQSHMKRAADTWGKNGTDKMWMAPLQEVYEYLVMRKFSNFTTTLSGSKMELNFDLFNVPKWLRRRSLTLVVNSSINFSSISLPLGVKATFKGVGNQKLINLDFTDFKTTGIFEDKNTSSVLNVYPNPADDLLTIELPENNKFTSIITIYDINGKVVRTEQGKGKMTQLDTSTLSEGYYILLVQQDNKIFRSSFVK